MALLTKAFTSLGNLKLWFNSKSGISPKLSDVPEIIPLRWTYFRDNWEFLLPTIESKVADYIYPDQLESQISDFNRFIQIQRNNQNKNINPFAKGSVLTDFYSIWENIEIASLPMTRQETDLLQNKINATQRYIKTDFLKIRGDLASARDQLADVIGTSDVDYNKTFVRSSVRTLRTARIQDINVMQTLQTGIGAVDFILANSNSLSTVSVDPFALARANANNPDIDIQTNRSGKLVRMFFGDSLESLAYRYLGDANRWIEIAIANGLKPPYIDEIGETISLLSNGSGNQINIASLDVNGVRNRQKFYINQAIFLQSDTVRFPDQRIIINIKEIPVSGEIVLELDGEEPLDNFLINENAHVRVFKPNTINSNFLILIPLPQSPDTAAPNEVPFFLASKKEDERNAGVDLAINENADLVFTSNGDLQLSFGLANAIQAVQLKMVSEKGQNPRHPSFGLPNVIGTKGTQPTQIRETLINGINQLIDADSRFDRIETLDVRVARGTAQINLVVRLAGTGSLVPISFTVNTG